MTVPTGEDQRRARRYAKPGLVWYHVLDSDPAIEGIGSSMNVSRTGIAFIASHTVQEGARVLMHIRSRDLQLTGLARVVRVRALTADQWEVGVRIEVVPPDHRAMLEELFR